MSSFARTIQKRALKRLGFHRKHTEVRYGAGGVPYIHKFKKGQGPIVDSEGNEYGRTWPKGVPTCRS